MESNSYWVTCSTGRTGRVAAGSAVVLQPELSRFDFGRMHSLSSRLSANGYALPVGRASGSVGAQHTEGA